MSIRLIRDPYEHQYLQPCIWNLRDMKRVHAFVDLCYILVNTSRFNSTICLDKTMSLDHTQGYARHVFRTIRHITNRMCGQAHMNNCIWSS